MLVKDIPTMYWRLKCNIVSLGNHHKIINKVCYIWINKVNVAKYSLHRKLTDSSSIFPVYVKVS